MQQIDAYCERVGPGLWAEPVNALTNLAFLLAAWLAWRRLGAAPLPLARTLCIVLALIGLASALWHTLAVAWTGAADSGMILVYILIYLYAANRHFWGFSVAWSIAGVLLFPLYLVLGVFAVGPLPFFGISAEYWPVCFYIAGSALTLRRTAPATARGLGLGAAILAVSITLRSLDESLCDHLPVGTHFAWHLLNATMLGWMIEVYRRHRLAKPQAGR